MRQKYLQKGLRLLGVGLAALMMIVNYSADMRLIRDLPQSVRQSETRAISSVLMAPDNVQSVIASSDERLDADGTYTIRYCLFGLIPVKNVTVLPDTGTQLIPGGDAIGIAVHTKGVLLVGIGSVETAMGDVSPCEEAGLEAGDVLLRLNGDEIESGMMLSQRVEGSGAAIQLVVERAGRELAFSVQPALEDKSGLYRIGAWVRDSTAGIGTLSFSDVESGRFAALGHPISDVDTQSLLPVGNGSIVAAEIAGADKGAPGMPGELIGTFSVNSARLGTILENTEYGVFGTAEELLLKEARKSISLAYAYEAHLGDAVIYATVGGTETAAYDCTIVRVNRQDAPSTKGMVIEITDPELLERTGGIVQGMSGSPVIQDGALVGVVTHVFVNDPKRGYCIYAEWMYQAMIGAPDR